MSELLKNTIDWLFQPTLYFFGSVAILAAVCIWRRFFSFLFAGRIRKK